MLVLKRLRKSTVSSGSKCNPKELVVERATDIGALCSFRCGQDVVDGIIQEIDKYLSTNDLFLVKEENELVAIFCLEKFGHNMFLSDGAKQNMQKGVKPVPQRASTEELQEYLDSTFYFDSKELSLLAVKESERGRHIGSSIIENILDTIASDPNNNLEFLFVKALNLQDYSAVPFYRKCGFCPTQDEDLGKSMGMFRVIPKRD